MKIIKYLLIILLSFNINVYADINIEFEVGIYFIDPDSKDYILKDSTSKDFTSKLTKDSLILAKIFHSLESNIIYQKDNSNEWDELFENRIWRGSECCLLYTSPSPRD